MGVKDITPARAFPVKASGAIGVHLLLEFYDVPLERLTDSDRLAQALTDAANAAGLTCLDPPFLYRFPNGGLTGFLPLAESHLAFHTYPEYAYVAADVFTCGSEEAAHRAAEVLGAALTPGHKECRSQKRGQACR